MEEEYPVKSDIEISQSAKIEPIQTVCARYGIEEQYLDPYGRHKAKLSLDLLRDREPRGKYILVTAITPTPLGEGKTVTTVGLSMALNRLGKSTVCTIRQPSLGPTFGSKGAQRGRVRPGGPDGGI
jgi:formate--tetrahydrofolate ligase